MMQLWRAFLAAHLLFQFLMVSVEAGKGMAYILHQFILMVMIELEQSLFLMYI